VWGVTKAFFVFLCFVSSAFAAVDIVPTCRATSAAAAEPPAQQARRIFEPPIPLAQQPFPHSLVEVAKSLMRRYPKTYDQRHVPTTERQIKDEALALAQNRRAISINAKGGHQYRYDPVTRGFEIISPAGEIVFFWPLGADGPFHGHSDHMAFLAHIGENGSLLRPGFGVPEDHMLRLPKESLRGHWDKHHGEAPEWSTPEKYEQDAIKFAASDNGSYLVSRQVEGNNETLLKYDPQSNRFLVLRFIRRETRWELITYFKPSPARHKQATNVEYFFSKLDPKDKSKY